MKYIEFTQKASEKIYKDYLKRVERMVKKLSKADKNELLMEINSHIYEGMQHVDASNEVESLLLILENLGAPEEVLKPMVADKKMEQATKTFNPIHIVQALILNISNGIVYIIFSILYFFLFTGILLIVLKIFLPETGLFYKENKYFLLGLIDEKDANEILGNWFIPVMLISIAVLYFVITLLLKRNINNKK